MKAVRLRKTILPALSFSIGIAVGLATVSAEAAGRTSRCFRVDERGKEFLDQSPYVLCLTSSDLEKYPKAVVTVTLSKEGEAGGRPQILAKRHYSMVKKNAYGRRMNGSQVKRAMLVFNPQQDIVEVGFVAKEAKRFYFKPITPMENLKDQAPRQKLQLGKLDTR